MRGVVPECVPVWLVSAGIGNPQVLILLHAVHIHAVVPMR
jgi:hypothetical protein